MDFDEELRRFRERTHDHPGYGGLIILGTRQSTTAALLIGSLAIERVAFLLTPESQGMPDEIAVKLSCGTTNWLIPAGDYSSTLEVYKGVKHILEAWHDLDRSSIAVDITGGRKPMSVGLEKAAHLLGLKMLYVESSYGKLPDGRYGPLPGTQYLVIPPDPYTVFGDLEAEEAKRLYAAHDYAGAERIFTTLAKRVDPPGQELFNRYANVARAYAAWDVFDLTQAEKALKSVATPSKLLRQQMKALNKLSRVTHHAAGRDQQALATLADAQAVLPLLGSLYANACRREAQGRYDAAALLAYRCLELIAQHRLAAWGILSEQPNFQEALNRVPDLEERYIGVQEEQYRRRTYPLPDRPFGLFAGYMLLVALDDPLVNGYAIGQIERRTNARNKSLFAHGYKLINHQNYRDFVGVLDTLIDRLFTLLGQDRATWEKTYRFVDLDQV